MDNPQRLSRYKFMWWMLAYIWPRGDLWLQLRFFGVAFLIVLTVALQFGLPLLLLVITQVLNGTATAPLGINSFILCFVYGGTWVITRMIAEVREILSYKLFIHAISRLSTDVFDHVLNLPMKYHAHRSLGGIAQELKRGQTQLIKACIGFFFMIVPYTIEAALALGLIARFYTLEMTVLFGIFFIAFFAIAYIGSLVTVKSKHHSNNTENELAKRALDRLLNIESIKSYGQELYEQEQLEAHLNDTKHARTRAYIIQSATPLGHGALVGVLLAITTIVTGLRVIKGQFSVGDFVLCNSYIIQFSMPLNYLGDYIRKLRECVIDLYGIYGLIHEPTEPSDVATAQVITTQEFSLVSFEQTTFSYAAGSPVLNSINLNIPAGKTIGIVGKTGSGKSTIAKLLLRFYDAESGRLTVNGTDIKEIKRACWNDLIGYVPQEPGLFHDTIFNNIAYGKIGATEQEVINAAQLARIHDTIVGLSQGYQTNLGERGLTLSGGERQRIALARVILKNPSIFIFDEATSALDTATEQEILTNIRQVVAHRTTLIIAHRLSTVMHADQICVLDHGKIKEQGTHEELLAHNQLYAQLWYRQQKKS